MKYCRLETQNGSQFANIDAGQDGELWLVGPIPSPWDSDGPAASPSQPFARTPLSQAKLVVPVAPSKIVCVGRNYRDHAKELGNEVPTEPLLFFKPPSSLLAPNGIIRLPKVSERVDFEGELAVVIGKRARNLNATDDLAPFLHGFTLANDVTARDLQKKDGQWTRAKGFDTFCPVGPIVDTDFNLAKPQTIETYVNGALRQRGSTGDFIFALPALLEYITAAMTLEPGDLILTGTPAGVGPLAPGDRVEVSLPGLGRLTNTARPEEN